MKNSRVLLFLLISAALLCTLSACKEKELPSCREVTAALTEAELDLPAGKIYSSSAAAGEEGYITEELLAALYGEGKLPRVSRGWIEYSFFLPTKEIGREFAVILCDSHYTAEDTARLLCRRASLLCGDKTEEDSRVIVCGNFVCLIVSKDPEAAAKLFTSLVR